MCRGDLTFLGVFTGLLFFCFIVLLAVSWCGCELAEDPLLVHRSKLIEIQEEPLPVLDGGEEIIDNPPEPPPAIPTPSPVYVYLYRKQGLIWTSVGRVDTPDPMTWPLAPGEYYLVFSYDKTLLSPGVIIPHRFEGQMLCSQVFDEKETHRFAVLQDVDLQVDTVFGFQWSVDPAE